MAKIFISYKYGDDQVWQGLDQNYWAVEEDPQTGEDVKIGEATGRAYVNLLEETFFEQRNNWTSHEFTPG